MSSTLLTTLALLPIFYLLLWTISATSVASSFPQLRNKRICLLIAHPDDEAMFFAPTVLALTKPELGNHVKILCLSSGDADGLGPIRKKELTASAVHLGLRSASDVFVIDDPSRFPDSMTKTWSAESISTLLASAFVPSVTSTQKKQQDQPPNATIDALVTFDAHGISSHPNHISLYHGARAFLTDLMRHSPGWACPVTLYTLSSTNIVRKYASVLDAPVSMLMGVFSGGDRTQKTRRKQDAQVMPKRLLFVNGLVQYWNGARRAMVDGHRSQMVWFRWGWISLGRYMVVNDLKREDF